ncbi:uncharacterized protein LTR77_005112 [Saxophila tyrrhenica]|uniref:Uncharacterized protein n=1 Tax=Saxophila tyrrhenica TaxID=1690608 RepID=A0AAV9PDG6_9PEZI|nr:hypothetical protein LTR77_005112 [Saxophila tyrrhenica]
MLTQQGFLGRANSRSLLRKNGSTHVEHQPVPTAASGRVQGASAPLFVPSFTGLRRTIVEDLTTSLQSLEQKLTRDALDAELRHRRVSEAVTLLRQMDQVIEGEMLQARLEDPIYAGSRGLSVLHFDVLDTG